MSAKADAKRLKRTLEDLFQHQSNDLRLRDHLEGLRRDPALPGLTWFWGPELYRRNRVVFREFILVHYSDFAEGTWGVSRVPWKDHADRLEPWLDDVRKNRDTLLARRLLQWKFSLANAWRVDAKAWREELALRYESATGPAAQHAVLAEFEIWFDIDEATALKLYSINRASSAFILKHLPFAFTFWFSEKRTMWRRLIDAALEANDEELAFTLYRRQVDLKTWETDLQVLAQEIDDPSRLNDELTRRHPQGWGLDLSAGALKLLKQRGRDVFPYFAANLPSLLGGWRQQATDSMRSLARERGWWDLWAAIIRTGNDEKTYNREVEATLNDVRLDDATKRERLCALAGVSQEWNWPGVGLARLHPLEDAVATRLYRAYPEMVRGPFRSQVVPTWYQGGPKLLAAAQERGDDELVDLLASRYITRARFDWAWNRKELDAVVEVANELAAMYQRLRDRDELTFARRAANLLTQIPSFAIQGYDQLLRTNDLARLMFVRSFPAYLAAPDAVQDLIEGSEIHVQMLGYRVLAQDHDRARRLAVESLDIVLGTLLRPLHRKTRLAAFGALANAARADESAARRVLRRAREALRLPDKKYPKEQLVGLLGQVLHAWPTLRGPREQPVIYGLAEALA